MKRRDEPAGCSQAIEAPLKMDTARRRRELERPLYVDKRRVCCGHLQSLITPRGGHEGTQINIGRK